eukprot:7358604-Pyramimonas_sp.AAC.1
MRIDAKQCNAMRLIHMQGTAKQCNATKCHIMQINATCELRAMRIVEIATGLARGWAAAREAASWPGRRAGPVICQKKWEP